MTGTGKRKELKSSGAGKPLRSRGFLSRPGGQSRLVSESSDDSMAGIVNRKSRGMKQAKPQTDRKPQALTPKTATKPYRLEDT